MDLKPDEYTTSPVFSIIGQILKEFHEQKKRFNFCSKIEGAYTIL